MRKITPAFIAGYLAKFRGKQGKLPKECWYGWACAGRAMKRSGYWFGEDE